MCRKLTGRVEIKIHAYLNGGDHKRLCTFTPLCGAYSRLPFLLLVLFQAGFDALYFGRIDYQDAEKRIGESNMEMLWRSSRSSEEEAQIFTGGFCR